MEIQSYTRARAYSSAGSEGRDHDDLYTSMGDMSTDHECMSDTVIHMFGSSSHRPSAFGKSMELERLSQRADLSVIQEAPLPQAEKSGSSLLKGFFFMNNFCLLNNCAALVFKLLLQQGISVVVLALFRNVVLLVISLLGAFYFRKGCFERGQSPLLTGSTPSTSISLRFLDRRFLQAQVRSFFATTSFFLFTINLTLIPITFIIIIFQTNPLWSAILGYAFNRERVSPVELGSMLASFACVILIASARSQAAAADNGEELEVTAVSSEDAVDANTGLWLGVFLCLCHAWLFSSIGVISRKLQNVHFTELMLHQSAQGVLLTLLILAGLFFFKGENPLGELSLNQAGILVGGCLCDSLAMISMCIAFQVESTSVVSMVGYLAIVYAILTDICIFGDTLSKVELLGCLAVVLITLFTAWYRTRSGITGEKEETLNAIVDITSDDLYKVMDSEDPKEAVNKTALFSSHGSNSSWNEQCH